MRSTRVVEQLLLRLFLDRAVSVAVVNTACGDTRAMTGLKIINADYPISAPAYSRLFQFRSEEGLDYW